MYTSDIDICLQTISSVTVTDTRHTALRQCVCTQQCKR